MSNEKKDEFKQKIDLSLKPVKYELYNFLKFCLKLKHVNLNGSMLHYFLSNIEASEKTVSITRTTLHNIV